MIRLEQIAEILEESAIGTPGRDIFVNAIPAEVDGLLIRQNFGGTDINHYLPKYRKGSFMLIARTKTYQPGLELIEAATKALSLTDVTRDGIFFHYIRPETEPFVYQRSPGDRIEFVVYIDCCYVLV